MGVASRVSIPSPPFSATRHANSTRKQIPPVSANRSISPRDPPCFSFSPGAPPAGLSSGFIFSFSSPLPHTRGVKSSFIRFRFGL